MKIQIEISRERYDSLLDRVTKESRLYSTLMSAVILRESVAIRPTDTIMTICKDDEAIGLLQLAQQCCPEAASQIEQAINSRGLLSHRKVIFPSSFFVAGMAAGDPLHIARGANRIDAISLT